MNISKLFNLDVNWEINSPIINSALESHIPKIDSSYEFDENLTKAILACFKFNKKLLIQGLHGTGKSSHIEQVAAKLNWPVIRINLDGQISRTDLLGKDAIILKEGRQVTEFQEGILPFAAKNPIAIILDEYDAAKPDLLFILQRILEKNGKIFIAEKNLLITPHENFRIFATSNTIGMGDETGLYHGTNPINQGQIDRWDILAKISFPDAQKEFNILSKKFPKISQDLIQKSIQFANLSRNAFKQNESSNFLSIRGLINCFENFEIFEDFPESLKFSFLNKCDESDINLLREFYQRCFGTNI